MPEERDYILRLISRIAAMVRRLRERLRGSVDAPEIIREARAAQGELLGPRAALLAALDPGSAAALLNDPRALSLWIDLLRIEAETYRRLGDAAGAASLESRAEALERQTPDARA